MHTFLVIGGITATVLVLLTIIGGTISTISERRIHKYQLAEEAKNQLQYQKELKEAEKAWQVWAKKFDELRLARDKETDQSKRKQALEKCLRHYLEEYYFNSMNKSAYLSELGLENNWLYQKQ